VFGLRAGLLEHSRDIARNVVMVDDPIIDIVNASQRRRVNAPFGVRSQIVGMTNAQSGNLREIGHCQ